MLSFVGLHGLCDHVVQGYDIVSLSMLSCLVLCGSLWSCVVLCGPIGSYMVFRGLVWFYEVLGGPMMSYVVLYVLNGPL